MDRVSERERRLLKGGSFAWAGVYHDHATDELKTLNELSFKKSLLFGMGGVELS